MPATPSSNHRSASQQQQQSQYRIHGPVASVVNVNPHDDTDLENDNLLTPQQQQQLTRQGYIDTTKRTWKVVAAKLAIYSLLVIGLSGLVYLLLGPLLGLGGVVDTPRTDISRLLFVESPTIDVSSNQLYTPADLKLVTTAGRFRLQLSCTGKPPVSANDPTVILEAGLGGSGIADWQLVQAGVSKFARVCSYNRAGYQPSELATPADLPRDSVHTVTELHYLLKQAAIKPPFIGVGHSYGGLLVRMFEYMYPQDIHGLVLVDSSHQDQLQQLSEPTPVQRQAIDHMQQTAKQHHITPQPNATLTAEQIAASEEYEDLADTKATEDRELKWFATSCAQVQSMDGKQRQQHKHTKYSDYPLESKPLTVITAAKNEVGVLIDVTQPYVDQWVVDAARELTGNQATVWQVLQADLALLSMNSRHVTAVNSTHYVQLYQPQLVIDEIELMVNHLSNTTRNVIGPH